LLLYNYYIWLEGKPEVYIDTADYIKKQQDRMSLTTWLRRRKRALNTGINDPGYRAFSNAIQPTDITGISDPGYRAFSDAIQPIDITGISDPGYRVFSGGLHLIQNKGRITIKRGRRCPPLQEIYYLCLSVFICG
jgi:hypothetical protein